jgi:L-threonylcarbamoyladenylate synthase
LRLNVEKVREGEALIAFGPELPDNADAAETIFNLSPSGDLGEAAANLFSALRLMDEKSHKIAVAPIPAEGLGEAINDRLTRAAAPK